MNPETTGIETGNRTPGGGNLAMQTARDVELGVSIESLRSVRMGVQFLDCHGGSNAYALCKSPHRRSNVLRGPVWQSVFPAGGSHEASAERALRGAWDAHGLDSFNEVFNRHDADATTGTLNRRCAE